MAELLDRYPGMDRLCLIATFYAARPGNCDHATRVAPKSAIST